MAIGTLYVLPGSAKQGAVILFGATVEPVPLAARLDVHKETLPGWRQRPQPMGRGFGEARFADTWGPKQADAAQAPQAVLGHHLGMQQMQLHFALKLRNRFVQPAQVVKGGVGEFSEQRPLLVWSL